MTRGLMTSLYIVAAVFVLLGLSGVLTGCVSLQNAGVTSYHVETADGTRVTVHNGKELEELEAMMEKRGNDYTFAIRQKGVKAFTGQAIAGAAATGAAAQAAKAATTAIIAPGAATVGAAAVEAIAK